LEYLNLKRVYINIAKIGTLLGDLVCFEYVGLGGVLRVRVLPNCIVMLPGCMDAANSFFNADELRQNDRGSPLRALEIRRPA